MRIIDHLTKAYRIEQTMLNKLDRDQDHEIFVEACMLAGTHLLNAILHKYSVTKEGADLLHSDKPQLETLVKPELQPLFSAMKYIEDLRRNLRRARAWSVEDGKKCIGSYQQVKGFAEKVLG